MRSRQTAFFELQKAPSGSFPLLTEEQAERLCRRKVGLARISVHKVIYKEVDFSFPAGLGISRFRLYCKTWVEAVALARDWTARIRQHGALVRQLTTGQLWVMAECVRLLKPITNAPELATLDAVRSHLQRHPLGGLSRTLDDVRKEVVAEKQSTGRSDRHIDGLDYKLRKLIEGVGNKAIVALTTADLSAELKRHPDWAPITVHSAVQAWKIMLNYAKDEGYIFENPADRLKLPKIIHPEPKIFSIDEVEKLMSAALFADRNPLWPACRAYLAIGMFAGLRPDEIGRLRWDCVDLESGTIRVMAANAKDRVRRIVEIRPCLAAWLRPLAKKRGLVLPFPLAKVRVLARSILGLKAWPKDVMRHTFVSYHFAEFQDEAYTKTQVGHRDDGRIFYNHYMVPVPRPVAHRFWSITPPVDVLPCETPGWKQKNPHVRLALAA